MDGSGPKNIHLHIEYETRLHLFRVQPSDADTSRMPKAIRLSEPLNIQYFRNEIQAYADSHFHTMAAITPASVNEMFLSVYFARETVEQPVWAGTLIINPFVQVFTKDVDEQTFDFDRQDIVVDSFEGKIAALNASVVVEGAILSNRISSLRTDIGNILKRKQNELDAPEKDPIKAKDKKDALNKDTTRLNTSLTQLSSLEENFRQMPYRPDTPASAELNVAQQALKLLHDSVDSKISIDNLQALYERYWENKEKNDLTIIQLSDSLRNRGVSDVQKVSLQFERGFLERIQVWVVINGRPRIFENDYAIGFSSIHNFQDFQRVQLYERDRDVGEDRYIYLSDLFLNYDNILDNYTRDFSPADTAINDWLPLNSIVRLRKESAVSLFDSKIYSDLNGLRDESPNGLIQIEIAKRLNLNTERKRSILKLGDDGANFGKLNYMNVWGAITKLESKNRYLTLRNANIAVNDTVVSPSYATTLDFLRYETANLGLDVNILLQDFPNAKATFYFDAGAKYGYTPVIDRRRTVDTPGRVTVTNGDTIRLVAHTATFFPRITAEVFSQRRVGFKLSYQPQYTLIFSNNDFKPIVSYAKSDVTARATESKARFTHMLEFFLRAETSRDAASKVFFRARFFWQQGDVSTFFPQFQLGYAYNIFYRK